MSTKKISFINSALHTVILKNEDTGSGVIQVQSNSGKRQAGQVKTNIKTAKSGVLQEYQDNVHRKHALCMHYKANNPRVSALRSCAPTSESCSADSFAASSARIKTVCIKTVCIQFSTRHSKDSKTICLQNYRLIPSDLEVIVNIYRSSKQKESLAGQQIHQLMSCISHVYFKN